MATYWKSQPKKFCDFCKCWIAENKASVDFHERGKKHKENVEKRINELRKNGLQHHKDAQNAKSSMAAIEEAALKAFAKDVKNDPSLANQYGISAAQQFKQKQLQDEAKKLEKEEQKKAKEEQKRIAKEEQQKIAKEEQQKIANENAECKAIVEGIWMEATSEEGYTYYWNNGTMETSWEVPASYVSLEEQNKNDTKVNVEENKNSDDCSKGQKRKGAADVYGQWQTVVVRNEEPVDLQLPESANYTTSQYKPRAEQHQEKERLQFKEKTVTSLQTTECESLLKVGFKKRKFNAGSRKIRQRDES